MLPSANLCMEKSLADLLFLSALNAHAHLQMECTGLFQLIHCDKF